MTVSGVRDATLVVPARDDLVVTVLADDVLAQLASKDPDDRRSAEHLENRPANVLNRVLWPRTTTRR
jgi:hypothetical protein